jgi:AcrR family transcriptional regulator
MKRALQQVAAPEAPPPRPPSGRALKKTAIFRATIEELASADYGGLTFERVALRAGVNKTTLYRRWPTKAALVQDALMSMVERMIIEPTTGSLREDLVRIGRKKVEFATSFMGQSLHRLRLLTRPEPELAAIAKSLEALHQAKLDELAGAAVARGEVPEGTDMRLLLDMFGGALYVYLFFKNERVDDVLIARIVDRLLHGVATVPRRPARSLRGSTAR